MPLIDYDTSVNPPRLRWNRSPGTALTVPMRMYADYPDQSAAAQDWNTRISQPGVLWYHNFDRVEEVNQFLWVNGVGNDPNNARDLAVVGEQKCQWIPTGGADGGGYMYFIHRNGNDDGTQWIRPFAPLNAASNGRNSADPCGWSAPYNTRPSNTTITPQAYSPTQGGSQLVSFAANNNAGWYGSSTYANGSGKFDGTDFYVQVRVMADPRRIQAGQLQGGKFPWFTITNYSNPNQELVTYQGYAAGGGTLMSSSTITGAPNYFHMYGSTGGLDFSGGASGTEIQRGHDWTTAVCDPYNFNVPGCWAYATDGTWDTLLYHIIPGTNGGTQQIQVWAAHSGQTSYQKIMDVTFPLNFDSTTANGSMSATNQNGWNALMLTSYNNGFAYSTPEFWVKYDQVIFSRAFITCPLV